MDLPKTESKKQFDININLLTLKIYKVFINARKSMQFIVFLMRNTRLVVLQQINIITMVINNNTINKIVLTFNYYHNGR